MIITLKDITINNWKECIALKTEEYKEYPPLQYERFIASNCFSLAQSKFEPLLKTKAIYVDNIMVGFTMYGFNVKNNFYEIYRIMIDYRFQKKGYGKEALKIILKELKDINKCYEIYISIHPKNSIALQLYSSFGFKEIKNNIYPGEILMIKKLNE